MRARQAGACILTRVGATKRLRNELRHFASSWRAGIRAGRIVVGSGTYGVPDVHFFHHDDTRLKIGNYTSIAAGVDILLGGNHAISGPTTFPFRTRYALPGAGEDGQPWSKGDVEIGSDVWIGHGATILSGVHVGHGAVISAGSVVTRDVRPYAVVAGSPAREVRRRFDDSVCDAMLRISWWDWPESVVLDRVGDLADLSIEEFVAKYGQRRATT